MFRDHYFRAASLAALLLANAVPAAAQTADSAADGIRVFEPAYFDEFDPVTALELVYRTPGFSPQEGDGGRGLSDVRTNVLINGNRPPPKGLSIRQQLGEMPVNHIERIELIDAGARLDIDMQGYPQVVNVITVPDAPAYFEVISEVRRSGTGDLDQNNEDQAEIESTGSFSVNEHVFTLRGDYRDRSNQPPASLISIDPANPEQRISSVTRSEREDYGLDLAALLAVGNDSALDLNAAFSSEESASLPVSLIDTGVAIGTVDRTSDSTEQDRDFSAEFRRPLGARGTMMLAFVDAQSTDLSQSTFVSDEVSRLSLNDRENGETALRLQITRQPTSAITLRATATSAFNYFEGDFRLFENGVEQDIDGSNNRVEEDRQTIQGAVDWTPAERWTITGNLGLEQHDIHSRQAQSGKQTDSIGEFSAIFRAAARTTLTFESERDVGQLSFNQFLASSNLSSEILTAGATALEPERSSRNRLRYDKRFGDDGVIRLTLTRSKTDNPVRQVALNDSLVVSQNTSPQLSNSLSAYVQLPFSGIGRDDLILSLDGQLVDSETVDPITGETREISGNIKRYWSVELRRDPGDGKLAWGFSLQEYVRHDSYSVRSTNSNSNSREWGAWVEWEPVRDLKIRTNVDGPQTWYSLLSLYPGVRTIGLDPSFFTSTASSTESSASISVEWRGLEHIEISGSLSARPGSRTLETLIPFGGSAGDPLLREVATTPRATLRVRVYH